MSQRKSEYELLPGDGYYTPAWVTEALLAAETFPQSFWEPACGEGHMSNILMRHGYTALSDIKNGPGGDFFSYDKIVGGSRSIVTNPPGYSNGLAEMFVRHALALTEPVQGRVAMLLPLAWDAAKNRRNLFKEHPAFRAKYILTRRIRWENLEQKKAGPSQNHAWYVWQWGNSEPPRIGWLP